LALSRGKMFFYSLRRIVYYPLRFPGLDIDSRTTGEFTGSPPVRASGRYLEVRPDRSPRLKIVVFLEISRTGFPDSAAAANLHFISYF
jgi:hypothetical protein